MSHMEKLKAAYEQIEAKRRAEELAQEIEDCWHYAEQVPAVVETLARFGIEVNPGKIKFQKHFFPTYCYEGIQYQAGGKGVKMTISPDRLLQPEDAEEQDRYFRWHTGEWSVAASGDIENLADAYKGIQHLESNYAARLKEYFSWLEKTTSPAPEPAPEPRIKFLVCSDMDAPGHRNEFTRNLDSALKEGWQIASEQAAATATEDGTYTSYVVRLVKREVSA